MQLGLIISVLLHAAILGWALVSFRSQQQLRTPEPEPVAVGMIAPGEVTKVKLGSRTAKQPEAEAKESPKGEAAKKEAPKAKVAAAAAPPPPPPPPPETAPEPIAQKLAEPPPPPTPATPPPPTPAEVQKKLEAEKAAEKLKADEQRKIEEQKQAEEAAQRAAEEKKRADEQKRAEEQRKAEEQKRAEEEKRRQAELKKKREEEKKRREAALKKKREEEKKRQEAEAAKKKQFDADKIAALLNKVPDAAPPPPSAPPDQPTKAKGPALGAADGRDKQISASEAAMLNAIIGARLKPCWRPTSGGGGSDTPVVTLRWNLRPDGSLDGDPVVIERTRSDLLFQLAAEAAIRAVRECAPFPLPPDKYSVWKTITRDFDPSSMLR